MHVDMEIGYNFQFKVFELEPKTYQQKVVSRTQSLANHDLFAMFPFRNQLIYIPVST